MEKRRAKSSRNAADRERDVRERLVDVDVDLDLDASELVANIYRVANAARSFLERNVLNKRDLSFSGFTVTWVLWIWGPQESTILAQEAGVTKGTLTGILDTLETGGLVERRPDPQDGRKRIVRLTSKGRNMIKGVFPVFNRGERTIAESLEPAERDAVIDGLRTILDRLDALDRG